MDFQHDPTVHTYKLLPEFIENFVSSRAHRQNDMHICKHYQKPYLNFRVCGTGTENGELFSVHSHYRLRSFAWGELAELSLRS